MDTSLPLAAETIRRPLGDPWSNASEDARALIEHFARSGLPWSFRLKPAPHSTHPSDPGPVPGDDPTFA